MEATRHRLRLITGVALTEATYGSGTYGDGTYGMQASDALTALRYYLVPWPGGYLSDPSWIYRQGDTTPDLRAGVVADTGFLSFDGLEHGYLVLTHADGATDTAPLMFELDVVEIDGKDWLRRVWTADDLLTPGTFRAGVVLEYVSGRRLTVPTDDRHYFVVTPNSALELPDPPLSRWDEARWNYAYWTKVSP